MSEMEKIHVNVGSRKSELALIQTNFVISCLESTRKDLNCIIESMETLGDKVLDKALNKIGGKSLFTKELELALEAKQVKFVVHSLKDLPTTLPEGLVIGGVCKRQNPQDVVIMHPKNKNLSMKELPEGSVIGTSSLRRSAQLKRRFPQLQFENIRGNLNTRLRKLEESETFSAIVLAAAGVERMGWEDKISQYLETDDCMYAVGQGALAVECRADDEGTLKILSELNDESTVYCVVAERAFMKQLEGGCSVPLGVHTKIEDETLTLKGGVWSLDGETEIVGEYSGSLISWDVDTSESVNSEESRKRVSDEGTPQPKKKIRSEISEYCGISTFRKNISKLSRAYQTGIKLADILTAKGAKKVLKSSREDVASLTNPNTTTPAL